METLQDVLLQNNRYTPLYQHSFEVLLKTPSIDLEIRLLSDPSTDLRRYNIPSVDELAVILPGDDT